MLDGMRPLSVRVYIAFVAALTVLLVVFWTMSQPVFVQKIKSYMGVAEPAIATPTSFYGERVQPIFIKYCAACHDTKKSKGHLKLHDYVHARYSGRSRHNVLPGQPESSGLVERMKMSKSDIRAMPPLGLAEPSNDEIKIIELWIERNASYSLEPNEFPDAPELVEPIVISKIDFAAVETERSEHLEQVNTLLELYPELMHYTARDSANLRVTTASLSTPFKDKDFAALRGLEDRITSLDIKNDPITDVSTDVLLSLQNLREARLIGGGISPKTIRRLLIDLPRLERLTVDAKLIDAELQNLASARSIDLFGG